MNLSRKLLIIKPGQFKQEEFDVVQTKTKNKKISIKYLTNYGKEGNSTAYCTDTSTPYITRTHKTSGQNTASSLSPRKLTVVLPRITGV